MRQSSHKVREQHWMSVIQQCNRECKEEGITKRQWMKRNNINYHSFYRWKQKLRNNIATDLLVAQVQMPTSVAVESSVPQFVEAVPPKPHPVSDNPS